MSIDYAAEYNNRARIPDGDEILGRLRRGSVAYRERALARQPEDINVRYGATERQVIDLFRAEAPDAPVAMFIHGGFWRSLDPTHFSQVAAGLNARGVHVALSGYDLCPQVSIGDIVRRCARPVFTSGAGLQNACLCLAIRQRALGGGAVRHRLGEARRAG